MAPLTNLLVLFLALGWPMSFLGLTANEFGKDRPVRFFGCIFLAVYPFVAWGLYIMFP